MSNVDSLATWAAEVLKERTTHTNLGETCALFGLLKEIPNDTGSKFDRALTRFTGKSLREVATIAEQIGRHYRLIDLEEAAVATLEEGDPPLTEITRRDIARCFDPPSLSGDRALLDLLRQVWPIDTMGDIFPFTGSLADDIHQHMLRNHDWSVEDLLERLDALTCTRRRFFRLLEATLHPLARRGDQQTQLADRLNTVLSRDGYALQVTGYESGYPVYRAVGLNQGVAGSPKNLVFASIGPKPEIGFRDAINNDILILSNSDSCLVYDRPIPRDGLLWRDLIDWWRDVHCQSGTSEEDARHSLGRRLRSALASDAERGLFNGYFRIFKPLLGDTLPALIPQVYLHYDPAVVARLRHRNSFPRQRMDFLLLLERDSRIIFEVDGTQHFSREGKPSLAAYADMVRADRDLRLLGYELYRFGANELVGDKSDDVVQSFFNRLLERHRVVP